MTIKEYVKILPLLKGNYSKALETGKKYGLTKHDVACIRKILDFADHSSYHKRGGYDPKLHEAIVNTFENENISQKQLAERFGLSQTYVGTILRKAGCDTNRGRHLSVFQEKRLIDMCKKHYSIPEIARRMEFPEFKVRNHMRIMGITNGNKPGFQKGNVGRPKWMREKKENEKA